MIILIDSGVLGQLCRPSLDRETLALKGWFDRALIRSNVVSSKICDYEVRRGLLLAQKQGLVAAGIPILDDLYQLIDFLSVGDQILDLAADIWATARSSGQPTAGEFNYDYLCDLAGFGKSLSRARGGNCDYKYSSFIPFCNGNGLAGFDYLIVRF
jgi:hypothetical protein